MAITDAERHRLHTKLDQVLGEEDAAVLISHLPPSGWSDVARTRDLDHLEERLNHRIDHLEERLNHRIDDLDEQLNHRIDGLEQRLNHRIDRLDARVDGRLATIDERFARIEERFTAVERGFDARLEHSLREQTNRFLLAMGAMFTLATSSQAVIARLVGG